MTPGGFFLAAGAILVAVVLIIAFEVRRSRADRHDAALRSANRRDKGGGR